MKILLILLLLCSPYTFAKKIVDTNLLMTLDLDQMQSLVRKHIHLSEDIAIKSQQNGDENVNDVLFQLKKAALLVFARPNRDFMTSRILPEVRKHLHSYSAYHPTLISLVKESSAIIADKSSDVKAKSTYYYVIENILGELKPHVLKKEEESIKVYRSIASAKIKIPKKLSNFRLLEKMEDGDFDPSGYAQRVLDKALKGKKKEKKSWWKKMFG